MKREKATGREANLSRVKAARVAGVAGLQNELRTGGTTEQGLNAGLAGATAYPVLWYVQ